MTVNHLPALGREEFFHRLAQNPRPVIVDLWAPWCTPCKVMDPALKQVAERYTGQVDVWKINADQSPEVIKALSVMGIPTILGFAGKQEILRRTGTQNAAALDAFFDAALHGNRDAILPPAPRDRWLRSAAGLAILAYAVAQGGSLILLAAGGLVLFSAFYDRCPIFRAVAPRVMEILRGRHAPADEQ